MRSAFASPGGLVSDVVTLDGLDAGAAMRLAAAAIGATDLPAAVAAKVLATSEGNPLFIGELMRMLVDEGALSRDGERWIAGEALATVEMPPTIHALLAARIERLDVEECAVLERAAVVGRHFSRSAVAALLSKNGTALDAQLESLQRAELIERDTGWLLGEPALRFHHVLIRDAAYRRLLKGTRAELHQRFADWIEKRVGDATDQDETIGRHLEEAHRLLGELGPLDDAGRRLGERAAARLAAAGRRALEGDDIPLAASLLGRALERLEVDDPARAELALDCCEALLAAGDVGSAAAAIDELGRFAADSERLRAWHTCFVSQHTVMTAPEELSATVEVVAAAATALAALGDAAGEAKGHFVHALALSRLGQVGACEASLDRALAAARRAGDRRRANTVLAVAPLAALWGPSPVTRASGRCLDVVRVLRITQGAPAVEAVALSCQGVLEALRGRTDAAHRMIASAREMVEELGIAQRLYETDVFAGFVALLEGDALAAERNLGGAYEGLRDLGLGIDAARAAALLARALLAQDRIAEAEALSHESEALAGDDLKAAIAWRGVRAEALARRGEHAEAIEFAQAAVAIAASTDALLDHADARVALVVALRAAGREAEANVEQLRAIDLWEVKGATLIAERGHPGAVSLQAADPLPDSSLGKGGAGEVVRRRVHPNAASRLLLGVEAGFAARDQAAIEALLSDPLHTVEHPTGATYGRAGQIESIERMLRLPNLEFRIEVLATLGESLSLGRRRISASGTAGGRFDVGDYEMDHFVLSEVDEQGRLRLSEVFAPDHLGDAIARLYERYAELLPEGPPRQRAETTAHAVAFMLTQSREYPLQDVMAPDLKAIDHRIVGHELVGQFSSRWEESWNELARDLAFCITDVLALSSESLLRQTTTTGVWNVGEGAFETRYYALSIFASDGRQAQVEFFDIGQEARALARFDELAVDAADGHAARRPSRRAVRANAATRISEGFGRTLAARDAAALESLLAEDLRFEHWPTGVTYGAREFMITWRSAFKAEHLEYDRELLASLGDSLALHRHRVSVDGLSEADLADFGRLELEELVVIEADRSGKCRRMDLYAADKLRDAVVRLYQAYAEGIPDGPQRERAMRTARALQVFSFPFAPEEIDVAFDPDIQMIDHRILGTWRARGVDAVVEQIRSLDDVAVGMEIRTEELLAVEPEAMLSQLNHAGIERVGGGTYERQYLAIHGFTGDGRVNLQECFDVGDEAEAFARFDQLTGRARRSWNRVDQFRELIVAAWLARDWPAIERLFHDDFRFWDRRPLVQLELDRDGWMDMTRSLGEMRSSQILIDTLATRGERLVLWRVQVEVAEGDVGPSQIDHLNLFEAAEGDGRFLESVRFDSDDIDKAYAELDARFEAGEAASHPRSWRSTRGFNRGVESRDWDAVAALCAEEFVEYDHRGLAVLGTTRGAEAWVQNFRTLIELASDTIYRVHHFSPAARGHFVRGGWYGKSAGGDYEMPLNAVVELDQRGLIVRADIYDDDGVEAALARLAELDDPRASTAPLANAAMCATTVERNAASAAMERWQESYRVAFETGDWEAMRETCAPDCVFDDRRRMALLSGGLDLMIASAAERVAVGARPRVEDIGTAGDRVVLQKLLWSGGPADGPFEIEYLGVVECDEGGLCSAFVLFDVDDERAVQREAWTRWVAIEPDVSEPLALISGLAERFNDHDRAGVRALCADDLVYHDHRRTGVGRIDGADAAIASIEEYWRLAGDQQLELGWHWPAYGRHGAVTVVRRFGQLPDGGAFESEYLELFAVSNGLAAHLELFELENLERALARFEQLRLSRPRLGPARLDPLPIPANAVTRLGERLRGVSLRPGVEELRQIVADDFRFEDRKRGSLLVGGAEEWFRSIEFLAVEARGRPDFRRLAVAGDRLELVQACWQEGPGDALFEIEHYVLSELDSAGKLRALIIFDSDDRAAAAAELFERYVASGAEGMPAGAIEFCRGLNARDVVVARRGLCDDFVLDDHRRTGLGLVEGADAYIASVAAMQELIPEGRVDFLYFAAIAEYGRVGVVRGAGKNTEGGEVESVFVVLWLFRDDEIARAEFFEVEQLDAALARFEALGAVDT